MQRIRPPATIVIAAVMCIAATGAAADEAKTSDSMRDLVTTVFGELAERMGAQARSRPGAAGRAVTAPSVAGENGSARRLPERPARTDDLGTALERLKATDRLRGAHKLGADGAALGLRIPLSDRTAIVPTYDFDERDVGMAGTDGDRAHRFRIGASLRF